MPLTFEVTTTEDEIAAQPGDETEVVFTVTNQLAEPVGGRASFRADEGTPEVSDWLSFSPQEDEDPDDQPVTIQQREFRAKATEQVTVVAKIPRRRQSPANTGSD